MDTTTLNKNYYHAVKVYLGNNAGDFTSRASAISSPRIAMAGAHHAKIMILTKNASSSLGKVCARTSPLKKLRCTFSQPGAIGTKIMIAATTAIVLEAATINERRRCLAS